MGQTKEPTITDNKAEDFTCVTFYPDLTKFKMETLDKDTVDLFTRRAYDIAAVSGVKVFLNGKKLSVCLSLKLILLLVIYENMYQFQEICVVPDCMFAFSSLNSSF